MKNNITLTAFGYSNYTFTKQGVLYKVKPSPQEVKRDNSNRFIIIKDNGACERITLKNLYRMVFNEEYSKDTIQNLKNEKWKPIDNTNGKYYISNCGRVKSLCGYTAKLLKPYEKENGYLLVKINNKNIPIHKLVAFAFCENKYKNIKVEIHHKDLNRQNNNADNLQILSVKEHHKIHAQKESIDNERK